MKTAQSRPKTKYVKKAKDVKIRIGPVAEVILLTIATVGVVSIAICAPNALQLLKPFFKKKKYSPKQAVSRSIESLVRTGLVKKIINKDGEVMLELTNKGKWESCIRRIDSGESNKRWDKRWRVVIFDVPNEENKHRAELTRGMRLYGFQLLQKSVWVYPYPCDDFIALLREHLELKENVIYLTTFSIENDNLLRKSFDL